MLVVVGEGQSFVLPLSYNRDDPTWSLIKTLKAPDERVHEELCDIRDTFIAALVMTKLGI